MGTTEPAWELPAALLQPVPRPVRLRRWVRVAGGALVGPFVAVAVVMTLVLAQSAREADALRREGVSTQGVVTEKVAFRQGHSIDLTYRVGYRYAAVGAQAGAQAGSSAVEPARFEALRVGDAVAVVYRAGEPSVSALAEAVVAHPWRGFASGAGFAWGLVALWAGLLAVTLGRRPRRERRLGRFGGVAAAVVREAIVRGRGVQVAYRFEAGGRPVAGVATLASVPTGGLIVLYDPAAPERHGLYPLACVAVVSR